jgi:hypothetical protein
MNNFPGKTFIVAQHEFLKTIKRKEFLFMTFFFLSCLRELVFFQHCFQA